jgi:uncharacterized membrane protein YfhO
LEKSSPKALPEIAPNIIFYSDNKIVINAKNRSLCQLVLVENYLHEWEVKINGKSGGILPAYGVFRSVLLTPGNNEVVFEYKPHYLINAYWISGIGALLMIISAGIWAIKTGNQKENT